MSTPKGYSTQEKDDRLKAEFATVEPIRELQHGLSTVAHIFTVEVATDAVEANSTEYVINATAHLAQKGDVIRFTSGAFSDKEVKVISVTTNTITLAETLSSAVATGVTFQILRHKYPKIQASGELLTAVTNSPIQFVKDAATVTVTEDTVTPANNLPLPVKLTSVTGDINITAGDLNVQLSHTGANYDSTRIGDGTDLLAITAAGEAMVSLGTAIPAGTNNIGDVDVLSQPARSHTTDSIAIGDGTDLLSITASGEALVSLTTALPAGTNNIGDVDVLTEPATAADNAVGLPSVVKVVAGYDGTNVQAISVDSSGFVNVNATVTEGATVADGGVLPAVVKVIGGYDGANVQVIKTDVAGELQVDVLTQPARSHTTDSIKVGDGTDFLLITGSGEALVSLTTALPAGTNNIGDVDVLSQPARSHTTDSIAIGDGTDLLSITASGEALVSLTTALPAGTNNIGDVDVLTQPARSHTTDSIKVGDGTDFLAISGSGEASVTLTTALPAGTNNIGDVDVLTEPATAADGATGLPAVVKVVAGFDGTDVQAIKTDVNGELQIDVLSQPALSHSTDSIKVGDGTDFLAISGSGEASVTLTTAIPAGTNNIGDVDVLTEPATAADGAAGLPAVTKVVAGYDGANVQALLTDSNGRLQVDVISSPSGSSGKSVVTTVRNDYSSVNVTTGAWVQLVASLGSTVNMIEIFDSSGQTLEIGTGAAASETRLILVFPGGNGQVPVAIASGTRVSIRAVSATANAGELDINFYS